MVANRQPPNDDQIEIGFIMNYAAFGLLINFRSLVAILNAARETSNPLEKRSLSLSAWQALLSSYEDFAMLLLAILNKKNGQHLHHSLGFGRQTREGSTPVPRILKRYVSARDFLDTLGFVSLDVEALRRFGIDIPDEQTFEAYYQDFANSVRGIGACQTEYNNLKNRLKHGKAVLSNGARQISFLTWNDAVAPAGWERTHIETTMRHMKVAIKQVAKIYIRSLDFLMSFMMHYHPDHVAEFQHTSRKYYRACVRKVRSLGLSSKGLTY